MVTAIRDTTLQWPTPQASTVNLAERASRAEVESSEAPLLIEEMVRHMAVQQFVQALLEGEPDATGVPQVTLDGAY